MALLAFPFHFGIKNKLKKIKPVLYICHYTIHSKDVSVLSTLVIGFYVLSTIQTSERGGGRGDRGGV